jgi:hypothetical protein
MQIGFDDINLDFTTRFEALWLLVNMNRGRREACTGDDARGQPFIELVHANPRGQYDDEYSFGEEDRGKE